MKRDARFLEVDLEIYGHDGLAELVQALDPALCALHNETDFACVEYNWSWNNSDYDWSKLPTPEETIVAMLDVLERLDDKHRTIWNLCANRSMSIGIMAGSSEAQVHYKLAPTTLSRMATLGIELEITLYPFSDDDDFDSDDDNDDSAS